MTIVARFKTAVVFTLACVIAGGLIGYVSGGIVGALSTIFIVAVLGVLETSLSLDNAVVNAKVMQDMSPVWRRRFITWGMVIAVFGMRLLFPILVVSFSAWVSPVRALSLAIFDQAQYAAILAGAHTMIMGFGGAFLLLVGLKYFFDVEKDVHWIAVVEKRLVRIGRLDAMEKALALVILYLFSRAVPPEQQFIFLVSGVLGTVLFILVEAMRQWMELNRATAANIGRAGLSLFIYLEILDASFSFDGVIGAFALTSNIFVIALGLGIGAMFVRSLTLLLAETGTLAEYKYLEHGAFWAIIALSLIMFAQTVIEIPEAVTGLLGAGFIAAAFVSSVWAKK
jgi:hypothetical protein